MEQKIPPPDVSGDDWKKACCWAEHYIKSEIASKYQVRLQFDFMGDVFARDLSEELLSQALDFERRNSNYEAFEAKCRQFRLEQDRESRKLALRTARLPASHPQAWKRREGNYVLSHQRYQLPVGQGGFHVGTLEKLASDTAIWSASINGDAIPSADFLYVYDCGSEPKKGVVKEIRSIVARRPSRYLDMLFVSHFDRDHICGIPHLLEESTGLRVDTIVMPYLDAVSRIIAFGRCANITGDRISERFHKDLVIDPVGTMNRFNPRQIIMVMPSDEEGDTGFFELPIVDPPISGPDSTPWEAVNLSSVRQEPGGATVVKDLEFNIAPDRYGGWLLKPYVKRASREDREAFSAAVEVLLRWPRGSFHDRVQKKSERALMVTKHRTAVSRAYEWAFGDKNEASLLLYSGPAHPQKAGAVYRGMTECEIARVGWLGTGDANLKDAVAVRDFQTWYSDQLDWLMSFMLPHHGSAHNYDPSISVVDAEVWIAAAEPTRSTWKHPASEIVDAIKKSGAKFRKVGSQPETIFKEKMVVFWPK